MISLDNLTVSYGGWTLFDNISLLINFAILLDILISVLMLGIFFTKIDGKLHADDADSLTNVKD